MGVVGLGVVTSPLRQNNYDTQSDLMKINIR